MTFQKSMSSRAEQISMLNIMGAKFLADKRGDYDMGRGECAKFCVVGLELQVSI